MFSSSKIMFTLIMMIGTMLVMSSETWLGMWMGLEMNLIMFIPILFSEKSSNASESCMIYFLTQSLGSIIMLISILSNFLIMTSPIMISELISLSLMCSMLIKLGLPPFHSWFPEIMEKLKWLNCVILMTWQKIAPMILMSIFIKELENLLPMIIITTTTISAIMGLNQTSIRKIMAYSSINHLGWMIMCMSNSNEMWTIYLMIYSIINIMMCYLFNYKSSYFINQLSPNQTPLTEKILIISLFLSLGGLPPFLGFLPKWMVIQHMMMSNSIFVMMFMILSSLIILFFYIRMINSTLLINSNQYKWNKVNKTPISLITMITTVNFSLPVIATFSF